MDAPEPDPAIRPEASAAPLARRLGLAVAAVALSQLIAALALASPGDSAAAAAYALVSAVEVCRGLALLAVGGRRAAPPRAGAVLNLALAVASLAGLALAGWKLAASIGPIPAGVGAQLAVAAGAAVLAALALARWDAPGRVPFWDAPACGIYAMQAAAMFVDLSLQRVGYSNRIDGACAAAIGLLGLAAVWRRAAAR